MGIGVVLVLGQSMVGGIVAVIGGDLLVAGPLLVTGRPRPLPFKAARPGSKPGTDWSASPAAGSR